MAAKAGAQEALVAYRTLLRTTRRIFGGNKDMVKESAEEVRKKFDEHRDETSEEEIKMLIENAHKASDFLIDMSRPSEDDPPSPPSPEEKPQDEPALEKQKIPTDEIFKLL